MKHGKLRFFLLLAGAAVLAFALVLVFFGRQDIVHSSVVYAQDAADPSLENIPEAPVPLAAPRAVSPVVETIPITSTMEAVGGTTMAQSVALEPVTQNVVSAPQAPAEQPQVPTEPEAPSEPEAPTEPETPAKAVKPADITDVKAMAKFIFDAATEFWATEKDFCGTSTRPVSTRVAAKIGAGTAVDCPGGDRVRVDKDGKSHDSYAIGDHFRDYIDMPDLQYFTIYLSDKDYTVNPYGAREEVIRSYYQCGSERATYEPEPALAPESAPALAPEPASAPAPKPESEPVAPDMSSAPVDPVA